MENNKKTSVRMRLLAWLMAVTMMCTNISMPVFAEDFSSGDTIAQSMDEFADGSSESEISAWYDETEEIADISGDETGTEEGITLDEGDSDDQPLFSEEIDEDSETVMFETDSDDVQDVDEQLDTEDLVQTLADNSEETTKAGVPNITKIRAAYGSNSYSTDIDVIYTLPQTFVTVFNVSVPPKTPIVTGTGESGTLSYEWYSNTEKEYEGATLLDFDKDGRNDLDGSPKSWYTKPTTKLGTTYYFCKVTNTLSSGESNFAYSPIGSVTIQLPETTSVGIITNEEPIGKIYVKAEDTVEKQTDQKDKWGNSIEDPGPIGVVFDYSESGKKEDPKNGKGMYLYPSDTMTTVIARAALLSGKEIGINGKPGSGMGSYIYSLGGREEFDRGANSGWMGSLNGWYTNTGFDNYTVANGQLQADDIIYLKYTTNLGKDIGCEFGNGADSKKLKSLTVMPFKSSGYTTGQNLLNEEFDPDVYEYDIAYSSSGVVGVCVTPEAENANNKVSVFAGEQEYRGAYRIPLTDSLTEIKVMVENPNEEDNTPVVYTIRVHKDPTLLEADSLTVTEIAEDEHEVKPAVTYSKSTNTFTATLQSDTSAETYRTKDLKVDLTGLAENINAAVTYKGKIWNAENGSVTIPEGALFTGTRTYTIQIKNTIDNTTEIYYLQLQKKDVRLDTFHFVPMFGESNAEYVETFNGQLEGTYFQLDAAGEETGKTGFTSAVTDYNIYVGSFVDRIVFTSKDDVVINENQWYAIRLLVNGTQLAETTGDTEWRDFLANVLKKQNLQVIPLNEGKNTVELQLYKSKDPNITRTYTLNIYKKTATAAEVQEKIMTLPALEDLSYSRDKGTVETLKALYDRLTENEQQEISQEAKEKLEKSLTRIEELYQTGMSAISTLKNLIDQYKGKVTEENYKEYETLVKESEIQFEAMTDWIYDTFVNENKAEYAALKAAIETVKKAQIVNSETIGEPTDYIDDFMVSANAFNLSVEAYEANPKAYPVNFKDYIPSNPQGGAGQEACLPYNTPGRIKWEIEDETIFRIDSEIVQYTDKGLGGGNKAYDNEVYYMVPLKEGTTTFTVTLTDATGGKYYGQTPKMVVHVNSDHEATIEKLEDKLTNINSLPYTSKYDTWYYWKGTEGAEFSFHVNGTDAKVEVLDYQGNGKTAYTVDADGDVTVLLKDGYNPIEVTATYEGQRVTQVYGLRAKVISYTLNNESRPGMELKVGDQVTLKVTGLTTPVYKILRIYNPSQIELWYDTDMPYQSQIVSGGTQYSIGASTFTVTGAGKCTLSNGRIYQRWWGSSLYSETAQGNTGEIAPQSEKYFSHIPDITFYVDENLEYKPDIKIHTSVKGETTVEAGDTVTIELADLNIADITEQYPVNTTNTFTKLQTMQTLFMTTIPGLPQVTSEEYNRNQQNSLDVIKKVQFTIPKDTPDGTYTIKGGYVRVMHGEPSYGVHASNMFQMQIDDVTIKVQHKHEYDAGKVTKAATCTTDGIKTYTCSKCGDTKTEVISKTGHKYGAWKKVSDATVKAAEVQKRTCSVCGASETKSVGSRLTPVLEVPGKLKSISMQKGRSKTFAVTMENGDSVSSVKSSSTKTLKATLDRKTGKVTLKALKKGTAKLTIKLASGKSRTYTVKVVTGTVKTTSLSVTSVKNNKLTLAKGKTHTLKTSLKPFTGTQKVTYKSSNKKVVTVTSKGKIKAAAAGRATVTVTSGSKKVKVTVTVPGITNVKSSVTVKKNKTLTLKPKTYGVSGKVTYTSSNSKVASVTSNGKIKGLKKGTAKITIQAGNYKKTVTVKVK